MSKRVVFVTLFISLRLAQMAVAQSFHPIEIPLGYEGLSEPVASVIDLSPDGSRVGGAVIQRGIAECLASPCTLPFTWSQHEGSNLHEDRWRVSLYETQYGPFETVIQQVVALTATAELTNASWFNTHEAILFHESEHSLLRQVTKDSLPLYVAGMSNNEVVVGTIGRIYDNQGRPFRWTADAGLSLLDTGLPNGEATAISSDGRVVVGVAGTSTIGRTFRWTENGVQYLDSEQHFDGFYPFGVSHDGDVIVGTGARYIDDQTVNRAYRWSAKTGTQALPLPSGYISSDATDVSADGKTIVGRIQLADSRRVLSTWGKEGIDYQSVAPEFVVGKIEAMIWDTSYGTRLLKEVLVTQYGLSDELAGWSLVSATAISANGNVIAGVGVNPSGKFQGWVVSIPESGSLLLSMLAIATLSIGRRTRSVH